MNIKRKIAIAAVPAVMALASTSVDSKILLMSQEGWEVSFDGAANAFVMKNSVSDVPTDTNDGERLAGGFKTFGGVAAGDGRAFLQELSDIYCFVAHATRVGRSYLGALHVQSRTFQRRFGTQ